MAQLKLIPDIIELPGLLRSNGKPICLHFNQELSPYYSTDRKSKTNPSSPQYSPPLVRSCFRSLPPKRSMVVKSVPVLHSPTMHEISRMREVGDLDSNSSSNVCIKMDYVPLSCPVKRNHRKQQHKDSNYTNQNAKNSKIKQAHSTPQVVENKMMMCSSESKTSTHSDTFGIRKKSTDEQNYLRIVDISGSSGPIHRCGNGVSGVASAELETNQLNDNERDQPVATHSGDEDISKTKRMSCRRNLAKEFDKELTFKPVVNHNSLKIACRSSRQNLMTRLAVTKKKGDNRVLGKDYTFSPKINSHSIKLAQGKSTKVYEVQDKAALAAAIDFNSECTFKPQVSERSMRIAESLGTSFEKRQKVHIEKRKRAVDIARSPKTLLHRPKRQAALIERMPHASSSSSSPSSITQPLRTRLGTGTSTSSTTSDNDEAAHDDSSSLGDSPRALFSPSSSSGTQHSYSRSCISNSRNEISPLPKDQSDIKEAKNATHFCEASHRDKDSTSAAISEPRFHRRGHKNRRRKSSNIPDQPSNSTSKCGHGEIRKRASKYLHKVPPPPPPPPVQVGLLSDAKLASMEERERVNHVRMVSNKIVKEKKIFLIQGGYRLVRRSLRRRGWVELGYYKKKANNPSTTAPAKSMQLKKSLLESRGKGKTEEDTESSDDDNSVVDLDLGLSDEEYSDEEEYTLVSRFARNSPPNFVWTLNRDPALYSSLEKSTITNHFAKASSFTTKVDLCGNLRNLQWYGDGHSDSFFPRCYRLGCDEDKESFIDDYKFMAAVSLLKILSQRHAHGHIFNDASGNIYTSEIPKKAVYLALRAGGAYISSKCHDDIEKSDLHLCPKVLASEWNDIVEYYHTINEGGGHVTCSPQLIGEINHLLKEIEENFPQFSIDGHRNIWIVKPGASSRGRGIMCASHLDKILTMVTSNTGVVRRTNRWVVQKYIERPLLIHETKFDIRQWFLVTDWNPLTMWMYQDCYLRFSSQPYTLDSLDVSVHLCNNSIQKHFENNPTRSDELPPENMWDDQTFQGYLSSIGKGECWDQVIYPGMKKALINVLQATQDEIEQKKNCFELYGADFMISSDYRPWLIEINSSPTMESSTEVTTRLCRNVLEDTLKVVIDRRDNRYCDIGRFELAYKQPKVDVPPYVGIQLCIKGSAITKKRHPNIHPILPRPTDFSLEM